MSAQPAPRTGVTLTTASLAAAMACPAPRAALWCAPINRAMAAWEINTLRRAAMFLGQIAHESGALRRVEENLNYSAERLLQVFPKYFDATSARAYAHHPRRIGSRVYAGRMGNGNEATGDGYAYRGRGLIQLTGRINYAQIGQLIGLPLEQSPDRLAAEPVIAAAASAAWWFANGLNRLADSGDILMVSRKVNLGNASSSRTPNGYQDRVTCTRRAFAALKAAT